MDPEIEAMSALATALEPLPEEARGRVLRWAAEKYGVAIASPSPLGQTGRQQSRAVSVAADEAGDETFEHLSELYDAVGPKTEADKVLVAAWWFQQYEGQASVEAKPVNDALKQLGHGVGNITREFNVLRKAKPSLVIQLEKQGKTRQARKRFKVTKSGVDYLTQLMAGGAASR